LAYIQGRFTVDTYVRRYIRVHVCYTHPYIPTLLGTPDAEVYDLTSHESLDTAVRQSNVAHAKALSYLMRALLLRQAAQAVVSHSRVSFNRLVCISRT